ncbi:hypothetical protein D030_0477B, partial [Vibrio parahaemolyticus AQ3810]
NTRNLCKLLFPLPKASVGFLFL